jgi:predicted nucleic acid-binding protein
MVISADTSFLFSLYGNDFNTAPAIAWSLTVSDPVFISSLNHFELTNALRCAEFRKSIQPGDAARFQSHFGADILGGRLVEKDLKLADILAEASHLSKAHTLTGGHRGFEILHVAAAKIIGATHFLTFDANQKRLAENEGLIVPL